MEIEPEKQTAPEVAVARGFQLRTNEPSNTETDVNYQCCAPKATEQEDTAAHAVQKFRTEYEPIERDDHEARQLLQLSQYEGRDPLQDAVAGRLALDRLDTVAEGDRDADKARWADELRRELRERFNEIAPTKFEIPTV